MGLRKKLREPEVSRSGPCTSRRLSLIEKSEDVVALRDRLPPNCSETGSRPFLTKQFASVARTWHNCVVIDLLDPS